MPTTRTSKTLKFKGFKVSVCIPAPIFLHQNEAFFKYPALFLAEEGGVKSEAGERPWDRELLGAEYFAGGSVCTDGTRP